MARTPHTEASVLCIFGCPKFPRIMVSFSCEGLPMIPVRHAQYSNGMANLHGLLGAVQAMEWPTCTAFWVQCKQWNGQLARPFGCSASNGVVQFARLWIRCSNEVAIFGTLLFWMRCNNEVVPTNLIYFFYSA